MLEFILLEAVLHATLKQPLPQTLFSSCHIERRSFSCFIFNQIPHLPVWAPACSTGHIRKASAELNTDEVITSRKMSLAHHSRLAAARQGTHMAWPQRFISFESVKQTCTVTSQLWHRSPTPITNMRINKRCLRNGVSYLRKHLVRITLLTFWNLGISRLVTVFQASCY